MTASVAPTAPAERVLPRLISSRGGPRRARGENAARIIVAVVLVAMIAVAALCPAATGRLAVLVALLVTAGVGPLAVRRRPLAAVRSGDPVVSAAIGLAAGWGIAVGPVAALLGVGRGHSAAIAALAIIPLAVVGHVPAAPRIRRAIGALLAVIGALAVLGARWTTADPAVPTGGGPLDGSRRVLLVGLLALALVSALRGRGADRAISLVTGTTLTIVVLARGTGSAATEVVVIVAWAWLGWAEAIVATRVKTAGEVPARGANVSMGPAPRSLPPRRGPISVPPSSPKPARSNATPSRSPVVLDVDNWRIGGRSPRDAA